MLARIIGTLQVMAVLTILTRAALRGGGGYFAPPWEQFRPP